MPQADDARLLRRHVRGDEDAFGALIARYEERLWNYLCRRLEDRGAAEDLLQEVFLRLLDRAETLCEHVSIEGWLFRVAHNLAVDHRKRAARQRRLPEDPASFSPVPARAGAFATSEPEAAVERDWLRARIERQVAELPEVEREVFLLRYHSELAFKEIAELLEIPLNTALGRMHRAVERLRAVLGPLYEVEGERG